MNRQCNQSCVTASGQVYQYQVANVMYQMYLSNIQYQVIACQVSDIMCLIINMSVSGRYAVQTKYKIQLNTRSQHHVSGNR